MKTKIYMLATVIAIIVFIGVSPVKAVGQDKESITKFVTAYVEAMNSKDWAEKAKKDGWSDDAIKGHQVFRESFPDFNIKIKHLVIDGEAVVMWGEMSGTFAKEFPYGEFAGTKPNNKKATWTEIWYFTVGINNKMDNGEMAIDGVSRMKQAGIKCLPKSF